VPQDGHIGLILSALDNLIIVTTIAASTIIITIIAITMASQNNPESMLNICLSALAVDILASNARAVCIVFGMVFPITVTLQMYLNRYCPVNK